MEKKINLVIDKTTRDEELEKKIPTLEPLIRIKGNILFEGREFPEIAIIDTGAHTFSENKGWLERINN
jgi:hypothetical protein